MINLYRKNAQRIKQAQQGFTLVEVLAAVAILAVIGTAVLNVTGKSSQLLAQQGQQIDIRESARSVMTRMVQDVENAGATNVINTGDQAKVEILDNNDQLLKTYEYDKSTGKIYLVDKNGNQIFLIPAVNVAIFSPPDKTNQVKMQIQVKDRDSILTFEDLAMVRSVEFNSSPMPRIKDVTPNQVLFAGEEKEEHENDGKHQDDDKVNDDQYDPGVQTIHVYGIDTHFGRNSVVKLVPSSGTPVYIQNINGNNDTVRVYNSSIEESGYNQELAFEIKKNMANLINSTYSVYITTPSNDPAHATDHAYDEIAFKYNALTIGPLGTGDENAGGSDETTDLYKHDPNNDSWNSNDWMVNQGNTQSFGDYDLNAKAIEKKVNSNAKVTYYNHPVQCFDYSAQVNIASGSNGNSQDNPKAMLTLLYDPSNDWYYGFGIGQDGYVYNGPVTEKSDDSDKLTDNTGHTIYVGDSATLRAVYTINSGKGQIDLYVNGMKKATITQITTPTRSDQATGYLGLSVTDNKLDAQFKFSM